MFVKVIGFASDPIVDEGRGILRELDIIEELPCRDNDDAIPVTTTDFTIDNIIPEPFVGSWEDAVVHDNDDDPQCNIIVSLRRKRHIPTYAVSWGTRNIPYVIESGFSKYF